MQIAVKISTSLSPEMAQLESFSMVDTGYFKSKLYSMDYIGNYELSLTYNSKLDGQSDFTEFFRLEAKFLEGPGVFEVLGRVAERL